MKRRTFLSVSAGTGVAAAGLACSKEPRPAQITPSSDEIGTIGGISLGQLRKRLSSELFDNFLPAMDTMVIDHEYGGFMCNAKPDGTRINTNKRAWYEGRGTWIYSFLYNNIEQNPKYLDVAGKAVEFIPVVYIRK